MHWDLRQQADRVKGLLRFDALFRECFPENVTANGMAHCLWHEDQTPSLKLNDRTGACFGGCANGRKPRHYDIFALWRLKTGCDFKTAVKELSDRCVVSPSQKRRTSADRIVETYDYLDESGQLLHQTVRYEPKSFKQRRPDGKGRWIWNLEGIHPVLYRLPAVVKSDTVWLCEGEKDSESLASLELCGTTAPMGAGNWDTVCVDGNPPAVLRGKTIYVVPDCDDLGRKHGRQMAQSLHGFAASLKILELPDLPEKGDISDFVHMYGADKAKSLLLELAEAAPEYVPAAEDPGKTLAVEATETGESINLTDMGNAQRLARLFGDRIGSGVGWNPGMDCARLPILAKERSSNPREGASCG